MLVSIIVTTYNIELFVREAVESALESDAEEVVVVDDGSTDGTVSILREIAASDQRVRVLQQKNRGSSSARNAGAREARGKYILFLDGDDRLIPGAILKLSCTLDATHSAVCSYGQWRAINENGELMPPNMKLTSHYNGFVLKHILKKGFLIPGCVLMRRDAFFSAGGFDESIEFAEDWEFFCRLSLEGDFVAIPDCSFAYRLRKNSKSSASNKDRVVNLLATIEGMFANPKLQEHFSIGELTRLKKESRACALLGLSTRDFWEGHLDQSLIFALRAAKEYPPLLPRVIGRLGFNVWLLYIGRKQQLSVAR